MKPECKLTNIDGNVFNLLGLSARALRQAGQGQLVEEMMDKIMRCKDYDEALMAMSEYVNIT